MSRFSIQNIVGRKGAAIANIFKALIMEQKQKKIMLLHDHMALGLMDQRKAVSFSKLRTLHITT